MTSNQSSAQSSPERMSQETLDLLAHDNKTIKWLSFAALSGLAAYLAATFATVLQISLPNRFAWLGVCVTAFVFSLIFLSLATRKRKGHGSAH